MTVAWTQSLIDQASPEAIGVSRGAAETELAGVVRAVAVSGRRLYETT